MLCFSRVFDDSLMRRWYKCTIIWDKVLFFLFLFSVRRARSQLLVNSSYVMYFCQTFLFSLLEQISITILFTSVDLSFFKTRRGVDRAFYTLCPSSERYVSNSLIIHKENTKESLMSVWKSDEKPLSFATLIGQLYDDDIWLQLPEFISVLLCCGKGTLDKALKTSAGWLPPRLHTEGHLVVLVKFLRNPQVIGIKICFDTLLWRASMTFCLPSPTSFIQCDCCVAFWATCKEQQTSQLWMEGRRKGCGLFCSSKSPHSSYYCLNNLVADCSELVKDLLCLLHEHSVIQLICKEIALQANLQLDCTFIKEMKNIVLQMYLTYSFPFFVLDSNIFSFDTDRKRLAVMQRLMKTAGASSVTTSNCSFLEVGITEKFSA